MYEIVLMAAMTTTPEVPNRCGRGCRCGCYCGCYCGGWCGGWYGGCHGGFYGGWCGGCYGGCGGWGYWGGGRYGGEMLGDPKKKGKKEGEEVSAPATLIISLPAGARLLIDDQPTRSTSGQRMFMTPPLERGYNYTYNLRATIQRDGQPVNATQQVTVRAGETTRVNLEMPAATSAE